MDYDHFLEIMKDMPDTPEDRAIISLLKLSQIQDENLKVTRDEVDILKKQIELYEAMIKTIMELVPKRRRKLVADILGVCDKEKRQ